MELKKYISYCRVSTKKQDYGLTAQETDINNFINKTNTI
jgi:DNA invertase Pin-like site-specific DNA recombinase